MQPNDIYSLVKTAENNYINIPVQKSKYVQFDMFEIISMIDAYMSSQHISGREDSLGREKPFFNIVKAAVNVWNRATDIDTKNIRVKATTADSYFKAYVATILLRDWMKKERFGVFLNKWGTTLATYGSAITKFVEKDGELCPIVMSWDKMIVDPIDFAGNPKIEKLWYTPAELRKNKMFNQDAVEQAIATMQETRKNLNRQQVDTRSGFIGVYEVHGELPLSFLTGKDKDADTYRQQMQVIFSFQGTGPIMSDGKRKDAVDVTLYAGKEAKDPYILTHLIEPEGRTLSVGAVEALFDAQWMANHSVKQMKDQLDLASKMVLQTADTDFVGRNQLTNIETGDILVHAPNAPLTQVNNQSHDIPVITSYLQQWQAQAREIVSTPDAITGNTMPSGTAYRQVAILNQEAHSLFELMTENKGLALTDMMREYVIPFFKKKLNNADEVALVLDREEIDQLDRAALPGKLYEEIARILLDEDQSELPSVEELTAQVQERANATGATRFIKPSTKDEKLTWSEYFKELEWDLEIEVTNENTDKEATLTTLNTVLQTVAQNPQILQDPNAKLIFNKILEESGRISPIQLAQVSQPTGAVPQIGGNSVSPELPVNQ
jgi:hypothetical protein